MDKPNINVNKISTNASTIASIMYTSLIGVGIILLICSLGYNSVNCIIAGYSLLMAGVVLLFSVVLFRMLDKNIGLLNIILSSIPILLLIGIISYLLYIYVHFKDRITSGNIASVFTSVSRSSMFLVILEIIIFILATQKESFKKTSSLDGVNSLLMVLFQILNIILLVYLGLTMKYFVTDG
jgi:hypothetical protein